MKNPNAKQQSNSNNQNTGQSSPPTSRIPRVPSIPSWLITLVVVVILVALVANFSSSFWYFKVIENDEVGLTIEAGEIQGVLQPGIAYDFGLFVDLVKIRE